MDELLQVLAMKAERGEETPLVRVIAGGQMYVGFPAASRAFLEATHAATVSELTADLGKRNRRERRNNPGNPQALASESLQALETPAVRTAATDAPRVLTLVDVRWLPPAGSGFNLPTVRIVLDAVEAWWVAGGSAIPTEDRTERGWFVGGIVSD